MLAASIQCKTSSEWVVIFSTNFQLREHLFQLIVQLRCYLLYQLSTTLASLVRHLPSTLWSSLPTSSSVSISCKLSSKYVVFLSMNFQLREHLLYQLPAPWASLVSYLPSTLLSSLWTSNYVSIFSINIQRREHLLRVIFQVRCYLLYQLPASWASLVSYLPSTLLSSLSTSSFVSISSKLSSKYVVIFSINFQLREHLL